MDKKCFKWTTTISEAQLRDYFNDGSKLKEPKVDDQNQDEFDEYFAYDAQGRITSQRRGSGRGGDSETGGEYSYYAKTNKLEKVANGMGGSADKRSMGNSGNFVYDSVGNLVEDKSKSLKISYDWRGMPVEFVHDAKDPKDAYKLLMAYDGSGRRVSKTRYAKHDQFGYWTRNVVTHYTGIGTEVREAMRRSASPKTTVVVNLPQGLGRYMPEDAEKAAGTAIPLDKDGKPVFMGEATPEFEWYLKNHLGSTMLVYGSQPYNDKYSSYAGGVKAAYDYRAFGEQVDLAMPTDKVTENFTGKEKDDETELNYFGARYLDPMLGMWTSVDPARQFSSPYLYAGNGVNPVNGVDDDGNQYQNAKKAYQSTENAVKLNSQLEDDFASFDENNIEEVYNKYRSFNQAVAATGKNGAAATVEMEANLIPGGGLIGNALKPATGTVKRSVVDEVKEEHKETGSWLESIKNVILDFIAPTEHENINQEDQ